MMKLQGLIEILCDECKRQIQTVVCIPLGMTVTYGCKECKTPLLVVEYKDAYAYSVTNLRNMVGGFNLINYVL